MAVYENTRDGYTGFGLFQIRNNVWCDRGKNRCHVSCSGRSPPSIAHRGTGDRSIELRGVPFRRPEFTSLEQGAGGPGGWAEPSPRWGPGEAEGPTARGSGRKSCRVRHAAWDGAMETHVQVGREGIGMLRGGEEEAAKVRAHPTLKGESRGHSGPDFTTLGHHTLL